MKLSALPTLLIAFMCLTINALAQDSNIRGQLTDSFNGHPVEGVTVTLDALPKDDEPDYETTTGPFGFYNINGITPGSYELMTDHLAYETITEEVTLLADATERKSYALQRKPAFVGREIYTLYIQVRCAVSNWGLRYVPVTVEYYANQGDSQPTATYQINADYDGIATLFGPPDGFYRFIVNQPGQDYYFAGWETFTTEGSQEDKAFIDQSYMANLYLKPILQSLTFSVIGNDPTSDDPFTAGPLEHIYVEITGYDPENGSQRELLPPQVGVTNEQGQVTFTGLPGICYEAIFKKYGRGTRNAFVTGAFDDGNPQATDRGILPGPGDIYTPTMNVPYNLTNILFETGTGVDDIGISTQVVTTGIIGSNAEGFQQQGLGYSQPPQFGNTHAYMIAGKYRSEIIGDVSIFSIPGLEVAPGVSGFSPGYRFGLNGSITYEIPYDPLASSFVPLEQTIPATIEPAIVQGRLVAAEQLNFNGEPLYMPLANTTIEFVEREGVDLIPEDQKMVTVTTNDLGEFRTTLHPGLYGIRTPDLEDYRGEEIAVRVIDSRNENDLFFRYSNPAWPTVSGWLDAADYLANSFNGIDTYFNLLGMGINSPEQIDLELRLTKELHTVEVRLISTGDPTDSLWVAKSSTTGITYPWSQLVEDGTQLSLTDGDNTFQTSITINENNFLVAKFENIPPGDYTISGSHPHYNFIAEDNIKIYDWPDPGEVPEAGTDFDIEIYENSGQDSLPLSEFDVTIGVESTATQQPFYNARFYGGEENGYGDLVPQNNVNLITFPGVDGLFNRSGGDNAYTGWTGWVATGSDLGYLVDAGTVLLFGGPNATDPVPLPEVRPNITVRAYLENDPTEEVTAGFTFQDFGVEVQTPFTQSNYLLDAFPRFPSFIQNRSDNWVWTRSQAAVENISVDGTTPTIDFRIEVTQGYQILLNVTNATTGGQLEGAICRLYAVNGGPSAPNEQYYEARTATVEEEDQDSEFYTVGEARFDGLRYADYFVQVQVPGFETQNFRLPVSEAQEVDDDNDPSLRARLTKTIALTPLDPPTIHTTSVPFNRYGAFLPGVSRSGDASAFDTFQAEETLTMDWEIEVTPLQQSFSMQNFDMPDGTPGGTSNITLLDEVAEVYLVDQREFLGNFYDNEPTSKYVPEQLAPWKVRRYLNDMGVTDPQGSAKDQNIQFFQKTTQSVVGENGPNSRKFSGKVKLWELPPGEFDPAIIVVTRLGAVGVYEVPYQDEPEKRLQGIPIPEWLGFAFDMIGATAGASTTQDEIAGYVPSGKFVPFPEFSATIALNQDDGGNETNYIDYEYRLTMIQKEGQDTPGGDATSVSAGILGGEFKTEGIISVPGMDRRINFAVESTLTAEDIDLEKYTPKLLGGFDVDFQLDEVSGMVTTTASANVDEQAPWTARLTNQVLFNMDASFSMNLTPVLGKIPYVGVGLLSLDKTGMLTFFGASEAGIGLNNVFCWETLRPTVSGTTTDPDPRKPRQNFLGGTELSDAEAQAAGCENIYELCFRFAFGIDAEAFGGNAGASGRLSLTGNECAGKPSVSFQFNDFGDWPMIKRISGKMTADLMGYLNTPIKNFTKSWSWDLLTFDVQFGTDNIFQLIPMDVVVTVDDLVNFPPPEFLGEDAQVMDSFSPLADYALSPQASGFTYTAYDSNTMESVLYFAPRNGDFTYGIPVEISRDGYIGEAALLELADGRIIIVWSAVPFENADDPLAQADLRYSISDTTGANFTVPALLASLSGQSLQLQLHESGSLITALWIDSAGAVLDSSDQICLSSFDGSVWGAVEKVGAPQVHRVFTVASAGPDGPGVIDIFRTTEGELFGFPASILQAYRWDGTSLSLFDDRVVSAYSPTEINQAAAYGQPDGTFSVIVTRSDSPPRRYVFDPATYDPEDEFASIYSRDSDFALATLPRNLQVCYLDDETQPVVAYVWSTGTTDSSATQVFYAFTDVDGNLLIGPEPLTKNKNGRYYDFQVAALPDRTIEIQSLFENSPIELRSFIVSYDNGLDANDSDNDGMLDIGEFLIIDADNSDAIEKLTDVIATDDFDDDGFDNATEIAAGSDPSDADSIPNSTGVSVATGPAAHEYGAIASGFTITRPSDDTSEAIDVLYSIAGTATPSSDYTMLSGSATIPADNTTVQVSVLPIRDSIPEGDETISLTLTEDSAYTIGTPGSATLTIKDTPLDDWRTRLLSANTNAAGSGILDDYEADGIPNLMEFALALDPTVHDPVALPYIGTYTDPADGKTYLTITYTENVEASDLEYTVEVTGDVRNGEWLSGTGNTVDITANPAPTDSNDNPIRTFRDAVSTQDANENRRFIRVKVSVRE